MCCLKSPYFLIVFLGLAISTNAQLHADFAANFQQGCSPLIVQFSDLSTGQPTKWVWDLGNGTVSTLKNPGAAYVNPGVYTVQLHIKDNSGNEDSIVKINYITVYENPSVELMAFPTQGCAPLKVQFNDKSTAGSGTISQWLWDFGDGNISPVQNPLHTYNNQGNFNVSLSIVNSFGCRKTLQKPALIKITGALLADFSYSYDNVCKPPSTVSFTNLSQSQSPASYQWLFGDGYASTAQNPVHVYTTSGNFTIQLVTINTVGCSDTSTQLISIGSAKADFTYSNACVDKVMVFTDASTPKSINQTWDFGDGTSATGATVQHTYNTSGTYQVTLIADFGGCYDTIKKTIQTRKSVHADFTASGNLLTCSYPETITFTNLSQGSTDYKWFFGDNTQTTTEKNPVHVYKAPGQYSVKLIAYNQSGCADSIIKTNLVQIGPPVIQNIQNLPAFGCAPKTITMKPVISSGEKIVSYQWTFGDGTTSADSVPAHTYKNPGSYRVTLAVTAEGGCSDTLVLPNAVALGTRPQAGFSADPLVACAQFPIQFTDSSKGNPSTWLWLFGDKTTSTEQNPQHYYTDTGFFNVSLIISQDFCYDTINLNNYIHINAPVAQFTYKINCDSPFTFSFTDRSIDAHTWLWDFGDNTTSTDENPTHTYAATGKYIISLLVRNGNCSYTKTDSLNVIQEKPLFDYTSASAHNCKYDSIYFFATNYNAGNIIAFQWDFGDGIKTSNSKANANVYHLYQNAGTYFPKLTITDANNCKNNVQQSTEVKIFGPNAAFSNKPGDCVFSTIKFGDESTSDGSSSINKWIWDYGDSTKEDTLIAGPFQHTYTTKGIYNVFLKVIDNNNCYDTVTNVNTINITQPVAAFSAVDSQSCVLGSIQFIDSASGESLSYQWNFGDGQSSTDPAPSHKYNNEGVYDVKLNLKDKFGCLDSLFKPQYITVADPVAAFSVTDSFFACPPAIISPQNHSLNYNALTWDFGDSSTSTEIFPQHNYTMGGNYALTLITQGFGNCYDTAVKNIIIKGPSGRLTYTPLLGCDSLRVFFSATTHNTVEYIWDFGNGEVRNTADSQINYLYLTSGTYTPKLIIGDTAGCLVPIVNKDTLIVSSVKANFLASLVKGTCDSTRFNFTDLSKVLFDAITLYKWKFGDGDSSSAQNPYHFYKYPATYNVQLNTITGNGCKNSFVMPVNVGIDTTTHVFASAPDSVCANDPVSLTAGAIYDPNANLSWVWDLGNGSKAYSKDTTYAYQNAGKYNLFAVGTSANGCSDTAAFTLQINPLPLVDAGADAAICLGQSIVLKATGAQTYFWNAPYLSCTNCADPVVKPLYNTTYFLQGTSSVGCSAFDSITVKVSQPPVVSVSAPDTVCIGDLIKLTSSGADVYSWQPANLVLNASDSVTSSRPMTTTTYTVIGKDALGCFNDTASALVNVFQYPTVKIADSIVTVAVGDSYQIKPVGSSDITLWQWSPPNGLSCIDCAQPVAKPISSQVYKVHVQNIAGCSVENQISILVTCKNENLFIPNTFSPNSDGMNDYFYPRGKGLSTIKSIKVFSRWGTLIFERHDFPPNQQSYGWDGNYNGQAMPTDVYIYVVEVLCDNGAIITTKGNLTLLR